MKSNSFTFKFLLKGVCLAREKKGKVGYGFSVYDKKFAPFLTQKKTFLQRKIPDQYPPNLVNYEKKFKQFFIVKYRGKTETQLHCILVAIAEQLRNSSIKNVCFLSLTRILLDTLVGVPEAAMAIATTSRGVNTCKTVI